MAQSSVEWLINQLIYKSEYPNLPNNYFLMSDKDIDKIIEQAKAMHRKEHEDAFFEGAKCFREGQAWTDQGFREFSRILYNETFGNETE